MAEQDLLPSNRVWSSEAQQWLPAKECAHPAMLHYLTEDCLEGGWNGPFGIIREGHSLSHLTFPTLLTTNGSMQGFRQWAILDMYCSQHLK